MRADRLLSILLLLQGHRRMTARELARRLEVSERTIHRDMEALSAAGVPVVAERGAAGGWTLVAGYETRLTGLSPAEAVALLLPQPARLLEDLGLRQVAESALIRLVAALPAAGRDRAEFVRRRIHVDAPGWRQAAEDLPFLPVLQEAVFGDRRLHLTYERAGGGRSERLVDPLGLVAKGRAWYLVAAAEGAVRTYRVSRIRGAAVAAEPCHRPPDFDLAAHWARAEAEFIAALPEFRVTVRAAPPAVERLRFAVRHMHVERAGPPDAAGWVTLDLRFDTEEEACAGILGWHTQMEVEAPRDLRDKVRRLAEGVVALYST